MKAIMSVLAITAVLAAFLFQSRQNFIKNTGQELKETSEKLNEFKSLQNEMQATTLIPPDLGLIRQLRESRRELIKLRGVHTRLSSTKEWSLTDLDEEIALTKQHAKSIEQEGKLIHDMDEAHKKSGLIRSQMSGFVYIIKFLQNRNFKPDSLKEAKGLVTNLPDSVMEKRWFTERFEVIDEWHPVRWQDCELVFIDQYDSKITPSRFYIVEKQIRELPDGSLARVYAPGESNNPLEILGSPTEFHRKESAFLKGLPNSLFIISNASGSQ